MKLCLTLILLLGVWPGGVSADVGGNPVSQFPITVDGQFTGGLINGKVQGEWSDITPQAFIAPSSATGTLVPTTLGDPLANSLLYAGLAPEAGTGQVKSLYLMYAYLGRTDPVFAPGELIFEVKFPVTIPTSIPNQSARSNVDVHFLGTGHANSFFNLVVFAGGVLIDPGLVIANGDGVAGFGPSPLSNTPHLLVELEVHLLIDPGFGLPGGPFPKEGLPGVYSSDPAFWHASAAKNIGDPPISSAVFSIKPDGFTSVQAVAVPEPSALILLGLGLAALCVRRR